MSSFVYCVSLPGMAGPALLTTVRSKTVHGCGMAGY